MQPTHLTKIFIPMLRRAASPSLRFEIKQKKRQLTQFLASLCFWKCETSTFYLNESQQTTIHYHGRPENKVVLLTLLGISREVACEPQNINSNKVYVSEYPVPNSICIPHCLTTVVKLRRSVEDILRTYSRSLRRSILQGVTNYRYETIYDQEKIDEIERQLLIPYAKARHDTGAAQLGAGVVRKLALPQYGQLDLLYHGEEVVGCHLGNFYTSKGKKYWHVNRLGYPEAVFSDFKRWGEVNSMNLHLALETAIKNGYDYCDYGVSLARPGAGLIEWKRRRRGFLIDDYYKYFYLKFPKKDATQFFWDTPLFGVEGGKITLHLGILESKTDEETIDRYHEMGYAGLYKVYLHCIQPPSELLIEAIRGLYADQDSQPMVITYLVN
jgi:hypothetical protein